MGGHEDWSKSIVQIARETPAVLLLLRQELTGEVLQVAVELHPLHRESRLVREDPQKGDGVVARVPTPVHVDDAKGLRPDDEGKAEREGDVLRVSRAKRGRGGSLDHDGRAALECLPRDRRADGHARPLEAAATGRADDERVARGVDGHERGRVVADGLMRRFEHELEELLGARGVPDAHRRALERPEKRRRGQVAGCSTRPFRTA